MKLKCKNRSNKLIQCKKCGLYHNKIDIEDILSRLNILMQINNKKINFYKLDLVNNDKVFFARGIYKFFDWIFYDWVEITIKDIENITKFLSYLYYEKHVNISEYAVMFFGYVSIFLQQFEKYYYYWSQLAIKSESYLAIKWAIEDYKTGFCSFRKKNLHKAQKLIKISQNLKKDFVES
ncbi:MAG: hypothetical protein ACI4T1_03155 [Christensenellales bacterium]